MTSKLSLPISFVVNVVVAVTMMCVIVLDSFQCTLAFSLTRSYHHHHHHHGEIVVGGHSIQRVHSFGSSLLQQNQRQATIRLSMSDNNNNNNEEEFSRQVRLREEAESPFRKVRYFFYINAAGGAFTSLAISLARIAAAASGINTDLMEESLRNAAIDIGVLTLVAFLYKRDIDAEQSRLKRATKGAEIAKLTIRASKRLLLPIVGDSDDGDDYQQQDGTFTTTLASLRRGRGIEKRVIIVAAGKEKIDTVLQDALELDDDLDMNDLIVVPLVLPNAIAPSMEQFEKKVPKCVATPVGSNSWKDFINQESAEAVNQGVDIQKEGFCVVLKKNGRVGQRTRGIFLGNLVGNVVSRRQAGMDVTNI